MQALLLPKIQAQKSRLIMVLPVKKSIPSNTAASTLPYQTGYYQKTKNPSSLGSDFLKLAAKLLAPTDVDRLQRLLSSNRFTSSSPDFHQNLDLAKQNSSNEFFTLKEQHAVSNFVNAVEQAPVHLRDQLAKHMLEVFIDIANMPYLLTYDELTKTASFIQNSVTENPLEEGITNYVLEQNLESITLSGQRGCVRHPSLSPQKSMLQLKDPQSYRIKPGECSTIIQELETKLLEALNTDQVTNQLQELYKQLPEIIGNGTEFQKSLEPILTTMVNALNIRDIKFRIENSSQKESFDFNLAGSSSHDKQEIALNQKTLLDHLENLRHENVPINDIRNALFTEIISTLIQEAIHIWQVNEASKLNKHATYDNKSIRLKDYEDNLRYYNSAFACLALKGDLKFYYEQPLEYDSQIVSQFVTESILEKITQNN